MTLSSRDFFLAGGVVSRLSDMGWGIFRGSRGVTARTGRGRQDSVRPAAIEKTVAVTVVRRRRTRLFYKAALTCKIKLK